MREIDELVHGLERLRDVVSAKDKDGSLEAVTGFLLDFTDTFGHDPRLFAQTYPHLEALKNHIEGENYEQALVVTLAFLAKFRSVRQGGASRKL